MTVDRPSMHQLVGAYLHQDMYDFYPGPDAAVERFLSESTYASTISAEIDEALSTLDDEALDHLSDEFGIGFIPESVGGYRAWLQRVAERARSAKSRAV